MPYYIINKQPVFLTTRNYKILENIVSKDKDIRWQGPSIQGTQICKEKSRLMFKELSQQYKLNPYKFQKQWIEFDLEMEEAEGNIWDLLYDYGCYYRNSFLTDKRDFTERLISDYEHESLLFPMGKNFYFCILMSTKSNFLNYLLSKKSFFQLEINVESIKKISGTLNNFTVISDLFQLTCSENITLDFDQRSSI